MPVSSSCSWKITTSLVFFSPDKLRKSHKIVAMKDGGKEAMEISSYTNSALLVVAHEMFDRKTLLGSRRKLVSG